jgi:hypothetical protein
MNKIVQVNTGRATHFRHEVAGILCGGSVAHGNKRIERPTGLKPIRKNITCKKCLAAYDKEFAEAPATEKELTLKDYKEQNISWIIKK